MPRLRPVEAMDLEAEHGSTEAAIAAHPELADELRRYAAIVENIGVHLVAGCDLETLPERVIASSTHDELDEMLEHLPWLRAQGSRLPRLVERERARRGLPLLVLARPAVRRVPRTRRRRSTTRRARSPGREPEPDDLAAARRTVMREAANHLPSNQETGA